MKNIILASQSPRRRELLTQIGLEFEVHPTGGEEIITSTDPVEVVKSLSTQKAAAVKEELEPQLPENWLVIGADTIVVYDGKILGKPKDEADAIRMLRMLQGQTHSVYTGVTLLEEGKQTTFAEETKVSMYPMTEEEIAWYVSTKEPMDKARVITIGCSIMKPIRWDACIIPTISAGSRKAGAIIWHISAWIMTKWKPQV